MKPGYSNKLTDETRFSTGPGIMLTVLWGATEVTNMTSPFCED